MHVSPGSRLGPYEIVSRIGAGGMGEVWRARDTRLDRSVAIKILPADFAQNAQLKLRFEREARAISQFTHPNICTLHDVGHEHGTDYLVMELLDGESLADRLARGPLPLGDVLRYGAQIASALDRAHRAGIVHRDLKPGNVMLTSSGAKLLDFGLAKAATLEVSADGATQQKSLTQEGTILGTFQYMSPEQLEGVQVDHRTDIFALGAVLYEMATGRRAFEGKTKTSLIAAIVSADPKPLAELVSMTPRAFDHLIRRCLDKNPERRWQSAHDIAEELTWIASELDVTEEKSRRTSKAMLVALPLVAMLIGAAAMYFVRGRDDAPRRLSFVVMPPRGYQANEPRISPTGNSVALTVTNQKGESAIWLQSFADGEARQLTEMTNAYPHRAFWSPDGKWIAYVENGNLMKVSADGGQPERIARNASYGVGGAWNRKGTILWTPQFAQGLHRVAASGGELTPVTKLDSARREYLHGWPVFLPDGDHFLYIVRTVAEEKNEIFAGSLSEPLKKSIVKADSLIGYWNGWLLFVRDATGYAQRFDPDDLQLSGDARKIIDGVFYDEDAAHSFATVADDGAILYLPVSNRIRKREAGWYDAAGRMTEKVFDDVSVGTFVLSPDETKVAMLKTDTKKGADDVYTYDFARGVRTKLTGGLSNHRSIVWAPDGSEIYFSSDRDGMYDLYAQVEDGTTPPRVVWRSNNDKHATDITPDGRYLLALEHSAATQNDIWVVPTSGQAKPERIISTPRSDVDPVISRDGQLLAYASDQSGRYEIYVRQFPRGKSVQVSIDGGMNARWTPDGSRIYFLSPDLTLMSAAIAREDGVPRPAKPVPLFRLTPTMSMPAVGPKSGRLFAGNWTDPSETIGIARYISGWAAKLER